MPRGITLAIGVALWSGATAILPTRQASLVAGCNNCNYPCLPRFDVEDFCLIASSAPRKASPCSIDGSPVTQCEPGSCGTWILPAGETLSIPITGMQSTLGPRNDLHLSIACPLPADAGLEASVAFGTPPANATATFALLFDGTPAQGCVCTFTGITCEDLPSSVQTIGIHAAQMGTVIGDIYFVDDECEATHASCPG